MCPTEQTQVDDLCLSLRRAIQHALYALLCVIVHFCFLEISNMWLEGSFEDEGAWEERRANIVEVVFREIYETNSLIAQLEESV